MSTFDTLRAILIRDYKVPAESLTLDAPLGALGIDSLSFLELMFKIEDEFKVKIPGDPPTNLSTVRDVVAYVDELVAGDPGARPGRDTPAAPP